MKKIHINENQEKILTEHAEMLSLYDTDLGDFYDEEEEEYITKVSEKLDELIRGLFDLKEYIDNTPEYVSSERGEREIQRIKDTIETLTNG